jgi:hypothetical protein
MSDEGFLRRWARRKTEVREGGAALAGPALAGPEPLQPADSATVAAPVVPYGALQRRPQPLVQPELPPPTVTERPLPTMEDVATLDSGSDFSAFVARGVDQAVRRGALKKLFADPHFNTMDRLDVYIDDYTGASPVSEAMLASLNHAKSAFKKMVEDEPAVPEATAEAPAEPQPEQPPEQETQ